LGEEENNDQGEKDEADRKIGHNPPQTIKKRKLLYVV